MPNSKTYAMANMALIASIPFSVLGAHILVSDATVTALSNIATHLPKASADYSYLSKNFGVDVAKNFTASLMVIFFLCLPLPGAAVYLLYLDDGRCNFQVMYLKEKAEHRFLSMGIVLMALAIFIGVLPTAWLEKNDPQIYEFTPFIRGKVYYSIFSTLFWLLLWQVINNVSAYRKILKQTPSIN